MGNKTKSHISGKRNKGGEEARAPTSVGHIETAANIGTRIAPHHPFPNRSSLLPSPSLHMLMISSEMAVVSLCWDISYRHLRLSWKFVCCVKPSPNRQSYYPSPPSLSYQTFSTVFLFLASTYFFSFIQVLF